MEVTQFTYFQQVGGVNLDLESAELTYGLERIAMYLQNVESVYDIQYNENITYGEVFKKNEYEHSKYAFELADVDMLRKLFDMYEAEANKVIEDDIVIDAYDYTLKCSHAFNLLDARGALSVSERTSYIQRVRNLARLVARTHLKHREEMNYPLINRGEINE